MVSRVPSLNWLRVFEAAARSESFARAAVQLNMSPAAVSQQVRALEDRLGTPLFVRHAHAVSLTEAGRAYLAPVQQSLMTLESATEGLFGAVREQRLYVQSVLIFAYGALAQGVRDFTTRHPDIALTLSTGNVAADFTKGFSDLKIVFGNPLSYGRESDALMGEVLYPVASPEIAEAINRPEDLQRFNLIEVATHRAGWPHFFEQTKTRPMATQIMFADSTVMAAALAANGGGVALARAPVSDRIMSENGLVACLPEIRVAGSEKYHLVYEDRTALRPPARLFREWLLDWVGTL